METTIKYPIWKQAIEDFVTSDIRASGVITRQWLLEHFQMEEPKEGIEAFKKFSWDFYANFEQFRRHLLKKHKVDIKSIRGTGDYMIIAPKVQTLTAMKDMSKDLDKTLKNTLTRCVNVDARALDMTERQENMEAINKVVGIKHLFKTRLEISITTNSLE